MQDSRNSERPNRLDARTLEELYRNGERIANGFFRRYFTAMFLYCFLNNLGTYDKISFCHIALIYTTFCYRFTLDRNGSMLLFTLLIVPIMTVFHEKESLRMVILSTFIATYLSMYLEIFYEFQQNMLIKSLVDLIIASSMRIYVPTYDINSYVTDLVFVFLIVGYGVWATLKSNLHNTADDILLILICLGHIASFYLEYFTFGYFSTILSLTVAWVFLKSRRFPRIMPLLRYKFLE